MDKNALILYVGFKFRNLENGKYVIRPIQLKDGKYGWFNDKYLNVEYPIPLTKDDEIAKTKKEYHYITLEKFYNLDDRKDHVYEYRPRKKKWKWLVRLKATIQWYFTRYEEL